MANSGFGGWMGDTAARDGTSAEVPDAPPAPTRQPNAIARAWNGRARWWFMAGAACALVAVVAGSYVAGWLGGVTAGAQPHVETTFIEVPALDPLRLDAAMPDVRGLDAASALQVIADAGIPAGGVTVTERPAAGLAGIVIEQSPAFGVERPDSVALVVSAPAAVPDLVGVSIEDAVAQLSILGAGAARLGRYEPDVAVGTVLAVEPSAGSALPEEVIVTVNVAPSSVFLTRVDPVDGSCRAARDVVMAGATPAEALLCTARDSPSTSSWLLAGAVDRLRASVGIPDDEEVGSRASVQLVLDGVVVETLDVGWGASQSVDIDTGGRLKLELTIVSDGQPVRVSLGDPLLLGDPDAMSRLKAD